jgi:phenylacetate-CoA oxygenase PaaI subunit
VLEVDISLANLALDLVGQATLLLNEAGDGDQLAFHRDVLDFKNCLLVEQPNGDFAQTIARHLLYTTWQHLLLQRLTQSGDKFLSEFAHKAVKEVAYHRELANDWTVRLGDGTEESARRMAEGLDWCWRFVPELFEVEREVGEADVDFQHRAVAAPFGKPLTEHQRVVAEAQQIVVVRRIALTGRPRVERARAGRSLRHVDRRQRRHQMCFTSSGMS